MELARTVATERSRVRGVAAERRLRVRRDAGGEAGKRDCVDDRPHDALALHAPQHERQLERTERDAAADLVAILDEAALER